MLFTKSGNNQAISIPYNWDANYANGKNFC
ncbi:hypothetical protein SAMN06295926_14511 [Lysinibacillus sp. AC-3]|nr:hypothetical protein SAMN06295926_14511 [Lysinibacillus sp. AC-3]